MRTQLFVAMCAAAAMLWLIAPGSAQAQETGTVTGKVVDAEGDGVADVQVRLVVPPQRGPRGERQAIDQRPLQLQERPGRERPERPEPVATATTNAEGEFTMENVPVGEYMAVAAGGRDRGMGRARVQVQDGETTNVTITLGAPREGRPGAGERPRRGQD